ncbi:hypothetical protein NFI96_019350 [Prochilodus magdalenae]|nr:hypothetical protein NFI96_019350 [Prochilodus magdalenae]
MDELRRTNGKKPPHSTLEKVSELILPSVVHRFLFSRAEFPVARPLMGAVFGALSGSALFYGLMHNISMSTYHRVITGCVFVAACVLGGMFSSYFRCTVLLMFPSVLSSRGRAYLIVFILNGLFQGPISNIQHNVQDVAFSMGCNIDLQISHSKVMWRAVTEPFVQVLEDIVTDSVKLQKEAQNVSRQFQNIRDEVMGQYGYDDQSHTPAGNSTQDQYAAKTIMRCDYTMLCIDVVNQGIDRCQEWFSAKWEECMDTVKSPVINHILCVPMKFEFLCNIMRVMTPWCKEKIPVEGNFGQTFDKLNLSISKLGEQFTTNVVFQKLDQSVYGVTVLQNEFRKELSRSFQEKRDIVEQIARSVQILLSFTFITIFMSAFSYARQYTRDIRFDNVYITTYFRQIDTRRKRVGKRYLLPLKKAEKSCFIDPWSLKIHPSELQLVIAGLVQVVSLALLVCVILATDGILYHILDIIRRHTFTEYSLTSSHDIHIAVDGESMLAKLLRKTIGAFNTSYKLDMQSSNQQCLPQPHALSQADYLWNILPLLLMGLMCCLQVYTNRLRRVITTFYFPKREKRRILFLYNLQIQRRISYVNRQCKRLRRRRLPPNMRMSPECQLITVLWRTFLTVLLFEGAPLPPVLTQTLLPGNTSLGPLEDGEPASSAPVGVNTDSKAAADRHGPNTTTISHSSHSVSGRSRGVKPLERTRPFAIVDGHRRSLGDVLQNGHPDTLLCGLQVGDSLLQLELTKNQDLFPKPPNIYYYLPNGTGVSMEESPVAHCYYHGSVRGFPESRVAISTCDGLRGVIFINASLSFELAPEEQGEDASVEGSGRAEEEKGVHLLYPTHQSSSSSGGCGVSHTSIPPIQIIPHVHRGKRDILSETKYIELVLVADHKEYLNYQKNNKTIIYRMLDTANQVDWFYRPLNVRVALLGLEIWSDQDKILVDKSPTDTLNRFLEWRTRELLPRLRHDNAQLVMGESFDGTTVGMASQSSMCSKDRSGGVNVDHLVSVLGVASTVAHELGHNLGMSHDTADRRCECQNEPRLGGCIMEPSTGFMPGQLFSSCSERDLSLSLLHGGGMCLFNMPRPEKLLGGPRCGNLYVEKGEECDCGLLDLRVAGWMCREPLGECDLPEFCTGSSPYCPPNVFLQNGEPCQYGTSYCYSGVCASLDDQCQLLWGANATRAPQVCFSSVNKQGNKYGNCGQAPNGTYIPCPNADVHCGRIQCQGGNDRPLLGSNAEILTTKVGLNHSNFTCRGAYFDLGDDVSDPAMVAQGTACALGKVCLDQRCQDVSVFGVEECRRKCNGRGMCNSNKNCHCDEGWAPPDCRYSGTGGSVDSGPARQPRDSNPTRVALLVIFLFVLPVILLFLAIRFPRCRRSLFCFTSTPFSKARQLSRTPATERGNACNGEQVLPLRYQWSPQNDIPLTQAISKALSRPAPPTKPLPPDPVSKHPAQIQTPPPPKPPVPKKPLPADPSGYPLPLRLLPASEPAGNHKAAVPSPCFTHSAAAVPTSSITPWTSFFLESPGRMVSTYKASDVQNITALLLSQDNNTLFVGAQDTVLSLDISQPDVITLKNKHDWTPGERFRCPTPETWRVKCKINFRVLNECFVQFSNFPSTSLQNCANFIRVLQFINSTHLYACGSYAYNPTDVILTVDNLSVSRTAQSAKGVCPFKGLERNTAIFVDEELYTTTTNDFNGNIPVISRHFSKGRNNLDLETLPKVLNDPTFISSFYIPSEGKVLFFFREEGVEYSFLQKFAVSRVAQVCTNDNGGERILQKRWTTFVKSQLVCQMEKQLPFTLLQDIVMIPPADKESTDDTLFYGIFTSQWALGSNQTAVCAFKLHDIKKAFSGGYKTYKTSADQWEKYKGTTPGKCGLHSESDNTLSDVKTAFLAADSVQGEQPLVIGKELYSRITAQRVQAANGHKYIVLYLLTETGFLHKVVLVKNGFHFIEEIQVFTQPQIVKSILLSVTKSVVFVGSSESVIRVPVSNCFIYLSCAECVLARDPFCGWDSQRRVCTTVSNKPDLHQDVENGNVAEQCEENAALVPKVVWVQLYHWVSLPCHSKSRVSWKFTNHSSLPKTRYLLQEDGSLFFLITPNTPLELLCVTEEQGYQQTVAIFSLKVQASPRSETGLSLFDIAKVSTFEDVEQILTLLLHKYTKSYYNEMVAVSILLAICLCALAAGALLWYKKSPKKTVSEFLSPEDFGIQS